MTIPSVSNLKARVTAAVNKIEAERDALLARINDIRRRLRLVTAGPLPPDELADAFQKALDRHFDHLRRDVGSVAAGLSTKAPHIRAGDEDKVLMLLLEGAIRAGVPAYIEALGDYGAGPRQTERAKLAEALRAELAELETADEQLVDAAQAEGLSFAHRADVTRRREETRLKSEHEAAKNAARETQRAQLDERLKAARAAGGRSHYIESGGKLS